jgi:hypothetical protein
MDYDVRAARRAGLFYLAAAIFYIFGMMYVEGRVTVAGDTAATLRNIAASDGLYRLGFLSTLLGHVCLLLVAAALYELFSPVDTGWARLIVIFVVAGVSIAFLNRAHQLTVLRLAGDSGAGFPGSGSALLAPLFLDLFMDGEKLAGLFWGLWLLPCGVLAIKSGFAPKALGAVLIAACLLYLFRFFEYFLLDPAPAALLAPLAVIHKIDTLAKVAAELGFIGWLIVAGFRRLLPPLPRPVGIH